ncbi:MAG: hypothetical protein WCP99_15330 [Burkholderiales bacterium]
MTEAKQVLVTVARNLAVFIYSFNCAFFQEGMQQKSVQKNSPAIAGLGVWCDLVPGNLPWRAEISSPA